MVFLNTFSYYFSRYYIIIFRCGCTFEIPSITRFVMKWQFVWFFRRQLSLKSLCHYNLFYSVFCLFSKHNFYVHIWTIGGHTCDGTRHLINSYILCTRKHPDRKWEYKKEVDFQRTKRYGNTWCDCLAVSLPLELSFLYYIDQKKVFLALESHCSNRDDGI